MCVCVCVGGREWGSARVCVCLCVCACVFVESVRACARAGETGMMRGCGTVSYIRVTSTSPLSLALLCFRSYPICHFKQD